MTNIIDITEVLKKNAKQLEELPEFFTRFAACNQRQLVNGRCDCNLCVIKVKMADQILNYAQDLAIEHMKTSKDNLYYGDILEVVVMAGIKLKGFCFTEPKG